MTVNNDISFSRSEINTGLKRFFAWIVLMGGYWQTTLAPSPIFIGFVLALGAPESAPSSFISFLYLTGFVQLVSHLVTNQIADKKRLVIISGLFEPLTLLLIIVLAILMTPRTVLILIPAVIMVSAAFGHMVNPLLNSWYGAIIPDSIRATYVGRRIMYSQLAGIVFLTAAGKVVDMFDGLTGFYVVFIIGILLASSAYLSLSPVRFPQQMTKKPLSFADILAIPRNDPRFIVFSLFYGVWSIGYYNALPNLNVLLLRYLDLSYSRVALYQNTQFLFMIVGYAFWPRYIQKFGAKPVMTVCMIPLIIIPGLWVMLESFNHIMLVPMLMVYGIGVAGIIAGGSTHLYVLIPKDERSPAYLVCWSLIVFLSMSLGPRIGAIIMEHTRAVSISFGPFTLMNIKLALASVVLIYSAAMILLRRVPQRTEVSPLVLVDQIFRRNPLSLSYNMLVVEQSSKAGTRAQALERLGRAGGPIALDVLEKSLGDMSPVVRRQAASSIGETGLDDAVAALTEIVADPESDVRPEAAAGLGSLAAPESLDAVLVALDDPDQSVRESAVRALERLDGPGVAEHMDELLMTEQNPVVFSALAATLSRRKHLQAVEHILDRREQFKSHRIRRQVLMAVAGMFDAGDEFYRITSHGSSLVVDSIDEFLEKQLKRMKHMSPEYAEDITYNLEGMIDAFIEQNTPAYLSHAGKVAQQALSVPVMSERCETAARALEIYVTSKKNVGNTQLSGKAFCAVCVDVIISELS